MPGKGDGIEITLIVDASDQGSSIPWTVSGFYCEHAERIPFDSGGILVRPINEDNIAIRPCGG